MAGRVGTGNGRYYALMARGKRYGPDPVTCRTIPVLTSSWTSIETRAPRDSNHWPRPRSLEFTVRLHSKNQEQLWKCSCRLGRMTSLDNRKLIRLIVLLRTAVDSLNELCPMVQRRPAYARLPGRSCRRKRTLIPSRHWSFIPTRITSTAWLRYPINRSVVEWNRKAGDTK